VVDGDAGEPRRLLQASRSAGSDVATLVLPVQVKMVSGQDTELNIQYLLEGLPHRPNTIEALVEAPRAQIVRARGCAAALVEPMGTEFLQINAEVAACAGEGMQPSGDVP